MIMSSNPISDAELVALAQKLAGVVEARIVSPCDVETAAWVRLKCQFGCGGFHQCLMCPPFTPTPEQMRNVLDGYRRAALVHFKDYTDTKAQMVTLERAVFLKGAWKAFGLGAGPCTLCESCSLAAGTCRHAENARPSMEACGIDVYTTVRKAGLPIEVVKNRRQCPNYYGLLLVD
jgi:predicted metal-binding protein